MRYLLALIIMLVAFPVHAASLFWDLQPVSSGPITIERGTVAAGPFTVLATVPQGTVNFVLTPGAWGFYRVTGAGTVSNTVQFSLDLYTGGLEDRVTALEARPIGTPGPMGPQGVAGVQGIQGPAGPQGPAGTATVVVPPVTTNLLTTRQIDSTHVELTCAGTSMRTTGSGLRRIVECLP